MPLQMNELLQHLGSLVAMLLVFCVCDSIERRDYNDRWEKVSGRYYS